MKNILTYIALAVVIFAISFGVSNILKDKNKYDFSAQSIDGKVTMGSFDGKYKIFYFGYTFCPDVCPTTLTLVSTALENNPKKDEIMIVFVTLDPQRDKVKETDEFVKYFYPNSVGIVVDNLDKMTSNFGVKYQIVDLKDSQMQYSVAHSSAIYLFDKDGNFVKEVTNLTMQEIKSSIEELLKH
ncbi:SCO1/SenC family protein [Campylobacter sputorum subsp. bubulus]|uniref:SCO1/SenC family protein n=1 Tax=Campylobacter sputorum subsp. sputorum TaxID=32024 RepID=A0A381DIB0_9BACT|nr:SCO family protein [Campylobacter sputorum]ASM35474.1 cytochrome oxidase biogenesis protein, Sco1/SenC/PrrC family [Campylobacter sputorum aubsp. sputorum RM3237]KAB0582788.1 SCO family protein [Campylobacter sputorum subsp. sputorum]QEL05666.1 cytochrome oxidase copper insertion factor, SCO1/SenC/PrrC family [Campylobacter sputorum subsp. sputorum]SUX08379.1 SCO1/SenC family protein [Campylobacter sputorum subsp. bubulus]SUX10433.1 SCO1/SenC family protein [Campylobacter sputorum subsp. sp